VPGLRLVLGGDVMLARGVGQVLVREGPGYPFAALAPELENADLFMVNLECALSARQQRFEGAEKAFYFRAEPDAVRVLAAAGVDLVSLANNHVLDAGAEGLADTLATLSKAGISAVGAGADLAAASALRILDCKDQHIGVLSVCDHQEDFAAAEQRPGIHYLDLHDSQARRRLVERVEIDARRCDHLIVSLHWMPNWVPAVPAIYRELAGQMIAAGARVLWGHSPHHILGCEWFGQGVALYSTGNLIDDYAVNANYRSDRQLLYQLELSRRGILGLSAHPLTLSVGRAAPADAQARAWIETRLRTACGSLGSSVAAGAGEAFEIRPGSAADAHGAAMVP
jgi:poly-gamma-glutamate synthesis protein (capsule biosynthesis protein)